MQDSEQAGNATIDHGRQGLRISGLYFGRRMLLNPGKQLYRECLGFCVVGLDIIYKVSRTTTPWVIVKILFEILFNEPLRGFGIPQAEVTVLLGFIERISKLLLGLKEGQPLLVNAVHSAHVERVIGKRSKTEVS